MKSLYKVAGMTSILLLLAFGLMYSTRTVSAAADGKITGTVKLDGAAPHMKGIDMSKDPFCVKQHENDPAHLENVIVGPGGGLQNVVLYISEGLSAADASAMPSQEPVFDQKNCMYTPHVLAMDVNQKFKVTTSDQTTHNIHPLPNALAGNIPWNKSQPPGAPPIEMSWKTEEVAIPVKVQYPSLDARLLRGREGAVCSHRRQGFVHHYGCSSGELHSDCMAGRVWNADGESNGRSRQGWSRRLYFQGQVRKSG